MTAEDLLTALIRAAVREELRLWRDELLAELSGRGEARQEVLSLAEAAKLLRCHPRTASRWIAAGTLRAARGHSSGSSRVMVTREEIARFLETRRLLASRP